MRFKFLKPTILGFLLIIGLNANAAIISGLETHTTSDGSVVDLSGLDWLSWDETRGEKPNDVENSVLFANGWRYASVLEFGTLMTSLYDVIGSTSTDNSDGGQWIFDNFFGSARGPAHYNLLFVGVFNGSMDECGAVNRICRSRQSLYSKNNDWDVDEPVITKAQIPLASFSDTGGGNRFHAEVYDASALVRTAVVSTPSTLAIFALGIMCLASRRFKKQS